MNPKVSVLIPAYNASAFIEKAIDSILNQSFKDFELIVVDDGSTDNTADLVLSYNDNRIRLVKNDKNSGLTFSRNRLINEAAGKYIAWLDADDIAHKERLKIQYEFLEKNGDYILTSSWAKTIDKNGDIIQSNYIFIDDKYLKSSLLFNNYFVVSSVMVRNNKDVLLCDVTYTPAEDYELWVRLSKLGKLNIYNKFLVYYRVHDKNLTATQSEKMKASVIHIQKNQLEYIGIHANITDLHLHYKACYAKAESISQIQQIEKWFEFILAQNKKAAYFDQSHLEHIVKHKWVKICTSNSQLGVKSIKTYLSSPLKKLSLKNVLLLGKYILLK